MRNDWTQGTVSVDDGIELFYTRTGNGEKPALVLAHGITENGLCWHQFASDLEADFDIIMYDAYGHGKSSRVDPNKRFDLIEDLNELINALNLKKPGVIGFSMGAVTAAGFAARYPEKLTALVLEDPPWHEPQDGEDEEEKETARNQARKKENLAAKKKTVKELQKHKLKESPNWEEAILPEWAQSKHEFDPKFLDHFQLNGSKWRDLVNRISVPTLIVTGDNELGAHITPSLGVEAIQLLDKGEFGHISGAGHCVRYEQYQPYLTMVQLFLKRNM